MTPGGEEGTINRLLASADFVSLWITVQTQDAGGAPPLGLHAGVAQGGAAFRSSVRWEF